MQFKCCGTGSSGNSYALIDSNNKILLLESGMHKNEILNMIDFRTKDVVGCLVTHEHLDHSLSVESLKKYGIHVFQPYLKLKTNVTYGDFKIYPFDLVHDVACYGFLIIHPEGNLLYVTDTAYVRWNFKKHNVKTIIVEANYDVCDLDISDPKYQHVVSGHMSLETSIEFVKSNKTDMLSNVLFCHISGIYSEDRFFIDKAEKELNMHVIRCEKGMSINL